MPPDSCWAGGSGFNVRTLGIASDALVASQIVTAGGEMMTLSDKQNRDLFWACRGAAGGGGRLRRWPGTSMYGRVPLLRTGGRANAVRSRETAFVHRDNGWYMLWYLKWSEEDCKELVAENLAWLSAFYDAIRPYALPW
jgi:hypothetical protein